jgi:hypothetical protein
MNDILGEILEIPSRLQQNWIENPVASIRIEHQNHEIHP